MEYSRLSDNIDSGKILISLRRVYGNPRAAPSIVTDSRVHRVEQTGREARGGRCVCLATPWQHWMRAGTGTGQALETRLLRFLLFEASARALSSRYYSCFGL